MALAFAVTLVSIDSALIAAARSFALLLAAAPTATPFKVKPPAASAVLPTVLPFLAMSTASALSHTGLSPATWTVGIATSSAVVSDAIRAAASSKALLAGVMAATCAVVKASN